MPLTFVQPLIVALTFAAAGGLAVTAVQTRPTTSQAP
jgi:hypothetical protein